MTIESSDRSKQQPSKIHSSRESVFQFVVVFDENAILIWVASKLIGLDFTQAQRNFA